MSPDAFLLWGEADGRPFSFASGAGDDSWEGRRVLVTGVQARPELNGRIGTARAFDVTKGRVPVILDDSGGDGILLRRSNLVSAADDFESTFEIGQEGGGREVGGREVGGGEAGASGALTPPPVPPPPTPHLYTLPPYR